MTAFVLRRAAAGIVILFVASFLTYVLVSESGDPLSTLKANPHTTQATIDDEYAGVSGTLNPP